LVALPDTVRRAAGHFKLTACFHALLSSRLLSAAGKRRDDWTVNVSEGVS
jgi:hypothetical protein